MIVGLRTDKPEAELVLCDSATELRRVSWQAHRQLAETLHQKLETLLADANIHYDQIKGIIVYEGPGSFTGLRIGISVANAMAEALGIPVVGVTGDDWVMAGLKSLKKTQTVSVVLPKYGSPVHITTPRK